MVAPLSEKVRPDEVSGLFRELKRVVDLGNAATDEEILAVLETKVNLLRRIARHHPGGADAPEAVEAAALAETDATTLRAFVEARGGER